MDRIGRFTVILVAVALPWFEPLACRAQSSSPLPSTSPPVQQPAPTTTKAAQQSPPGTASTTSVPPPRAWPRAKPSAKSTLQIPPPRPWTAKFHEPTRSGPNAGSRPVDPAVNRLAQNPPEPLPRSSGGPDSPQTSLDLKLAELKPAPLEPDDFQFPINLATALRLSDARPLIVAAAQASVSIAEAQLTRAKVILIPTLSFGADYIRHDGGGPDFNKGVLTAPSVNYFSAGAGLDVTNSGLFEFVNLTDAYFEPLVCARC